MPRGNIGGSLLPSSEARILQPIKTHFGCLQVRALPELDTHGLFYNESLIATHPNGYSCHVLLTRMANETDDSVRAQVRYILDCGGMARHVEHIVNICKA